MHQAFAELEVKSEVRVEQIAHPGLVLPLAPSLERRRLQIYLLLLMADTLAILAGFALAGWLYLGSWAAPAAWLEAQLLLPLYWTAAIANGGYSAGSALNAQIGGWRAVLAVLAAAAFVVFLAYFLKASAQFSRAVSALGTASAALILVIARDQLVRVARARLGPTGLNQAVVHDGGRRVALHNSYVVDAEEHAIVADPADPHALNRIAHVLENMDRVLVSCAPERRAAWALVLKGLNIRSYARDKNDQTRCARSGP